MSEKGRKALDSLIRLYKEQGFVSSNDIMRDSNEFGLDIQDVDKLSNELTTRGILIYDKPSADLVETFIELLNKEAIKEIEGGVGVEQENSAAREKFQAWIAKRWIGKKEMAKNTLAALDIINMRCRKDKLLGNELYEITDISEIERLTEKIVLNPSLLKINSRRLAYAFYSALETYSKFLDKNSENDIESRLLVFIDNHGLEYRDYRGMGGNFWILGGYELEKLIRECEATFKIRFYYNPTPKAKSLRGKTGWWTTDLPKF